MKTNLEPLPWLIRMSTFTLLFKYRSNIKSIIEKLEQILIIWKYNKGAISTCRQCYYSRKCILPGLLVTFLQWLQSCSCLEPLVMKHKEMQKIAWLFRPSCHEIPWLVFAKLCGMSIISLAKTVSANPDRCSHADPILFTTKLIEPNGFSSPASSKSQMLKLFLWIVADIGSFWNTKRFVMNEEYCSSPVVTIVLICSSLDSGTRILSLLIFWSLSAWNELHGRACSRVLLSDVKSLQKASLSSWCFVELHWRGPRWEFSSESSNLFIIRFYRCKHKWICLTYVWRMVKVNYRLKTSNDQANVWYLYPSWNTCNVR